MVETDKEFVEYVVKSIVSKPENVEVKRSVDEMGVLLELGVDKEDMGVIIGKEGKTAKALRTLLRVLGAKNDARVNLKIVEPEGSERPERVERAEKAEETVESPVEAEAPEEKAEETEETKETTPEEESDEDPMADLEL